MALAARHGLAVVEDNAHGLFGAIKAGCSAPSARSPPRAFTRPRTSPAARAAPCSSTTLRTVERAEIIREKGTNRSRFFRGQVDKYTWVDVGSSYCPPNPGRVPLAQLEARERSKPASARVGVLQAPSCKIGPQQHGVRLPVVPDHCEQPYHMFYLLMPSPRTAPGADRASEGARYPQRFSLPAAASLRHGAAVWRQRWRLPGYRGYKRPAVRLPFYNELTDADQARVVGAIQDFPVENMRQAVKQFHTSYWSELYALVRPVLPAFVISRATSVIPYLCYQDTKPLTGNHWHPHVR